ncbi:MAG: hypothetical protein V3V90_00345 [Thermodesulfobacteriota bacterium]
MEGKNRGRRPLLLRGMAGALNKWGITVIALYDAVATSIAKITRVAKRRGRSGKTVGVSSPDKSHWLADLLILTGTALPAIRKSVREMVENLSIQDNGESGRRISYRVSSKLIKKTALKSGAYGGLYASPGTLPVVGTLGTLVISLTADLVHLLRTQIELCYGIAAAYDVDMDEEELQAVTLALIGFSGTAEAFKGISATVIKESIDKAAMGHLQTGIGKAATAFSRKLGLQTTSKMTRLIPFLGIPFCASINIASTLIVGKQALKYFSAWSGNPARLPGSPTVVH